MKFIKLDWTLCCQDGVIIPCDYSNAYIFVKATITAINTEAQNQPNNDIKRKVIFKNCALFTKCINKINK